MKREIEAALEKKHGPWVTLYLALPCQVTSSPVNQASSYGKVQGQLKFTVESSRNALRKVGAGGRGQDSELW